MAKPHILAAIRNHRAQCVRYLLILLLAGAMLTPGVYNIGKTQSAAIATLTQTADISQPTQVIRWRKNSVDADKPHTLAASYYSLQGNLKATLMFNNKGPNPLEVRPALFSIFGDRFDAPTVTVNANSFREVDMSEWVAIAGPSFAEGNLQILYKGPDLVLGAQIKMVNPKLSLIFDEQLVEPSVAFSSSRLEGVWWLPTAHCQADLVLSNTTDSPVSVSVIVDGTAPPQKQPTKLLLQPHETRVMDARQDFTGKSGGQMLQLGAISIAHSGQAGSLLARARIFESSMGYSSAVQFVDPLKARSSTLHGAGLRLGSVAGDQLTPIVVARNISDTATILSGRMPYTTTDGKMGKLPIDEVRLRAGETKVLNLTGIINRGERDDIESAGLEFEYSGKPGSVIMSAQSVSRSGDQVFHLPLLDPLSQQSSTGGYPFSIGGDSSTIVYIKNVSDHPQRYSLHLNFGQQGYAPTTDAIQAGHSVRIDIRSLRDSQVADGFGQTIPMQINRGQVRWSLEGSEPLALIGRAEQVDMRAGLSSSYSCQSSCQHSYVSSYLNPGFTEMTVGGSQQFEVRRWQRDCYGTDLQCIIAASWSSSNSSVARVDSSGKVTALAAGTSVLRASFTANEYDCATGCTAFSWTEFTEVAFQVRPKVTAISPARGLLGLAYDVTISGAGFKAGASVSAGAGITVSGVQVGSSAEILATFTIAENAVGGEHNVVVTVSGESSVDDVRFFAQIPSKIVQQNLSDVNLVDPGPGTIGDATNVCGAYWTAIYTLVDQANPPQAITEPAMITENVFDATRPATDPPIKTKTVETNEQGRFDDLLAIFKNHPACPSVGENAKVRQKFSAKIGDKTFSVSTVYLIEMKKADSSQYSISYTTESQ